MRPWPFDSVLVANRGEIAVRVVRACRDAGLRSVAVYADPDVDAPHVRLADEALRLPGTTAAHTYLRGDLLLDAARRTGAQALHPGYGFLAEDPAFARAVGDRGLTWIGPPPQAMHLLGDKVRARALAADLGVPLAPGTPGPVHDVAEAEAFVHRHGLPVVVKAVAGGGGRGLRVVRDPADLPAAVEGASREAEAAFGRGGCFVERYLERPRHVETQCLADVHGEVAVVSTRCCTLQRRHQKLVEEAPAPFLDPGVEAVLRRASVDLLRAAGYVGAGTCEFLVGADGTVAFLEVNARLQVEHPVTEQVTGLDLVLEQFRLAAGEPLGDVAVPVRGHAVEFRVNAEDPARGFAPSPGTVTRWHVPGGPGVRVDGGVGPGTVVDGAFDPLLAKLVVTGATREQALARARRALAEFDVAGPATTLPLHRALVTCPDFTAFTTADGGWRVHTGWVEQAVGTLLGGPAAGAPAPAPTPPPGPAPAQVPPPTVLGDPVVVEVDGRRLEVRLPAGWWPPEDGAATGAGPVREVTGGHGRAGARGHDTRRARPGRRADDGRQVPEPGAVAPAMTARVVRVLVAEGAAVRAGDPLVVVEVMKTEQTLTAPHDGVVHGLTAVEGATVPGGVPVCMVRTG